MTPGGEPTVELVVDASVAVKWLLRDEPHTANADALVLGAGSGRHVLYAPRQIEVEIAAALRRAALRGRLPAAAIERALDDWFVRLAPAVMLFDNAPLLPAALPRSLVLGVTLFDALYLVLTEQLGCELVVADERLRRSATVPLPLIRSLGSIPTT